MNIFLYLFFISLFIFVYLFTILFKKQILSSTKQVEKCIFHRNVKLSSSKVEVILYILNLFFIIWSTILSIYLKSFKYDSYYYSFLSKCGSAIVFFILGMLVAQGKDVIYYYFSSHLSFIRSLLLSGILFLLNMISYQLNSTLSICLYFIHFLFTIYYFKYFNTMKNDMKNTSFIIQFVWLLLIGFIDSFSIIFLIFHL